MADAVGAASRANFVWVVGSEVDSQQRATAREKCLKGVERDATS
jgi:hypothetical protein